MVLYLLQKNKWKSEDDTTWEMKTGLETGAKQCLERERIENKTKQKQQQQNRMKEGRVVFAVELLKTKKLTEKTHKN